MRTRTAVGLVLLVGLVTSAQTPATARWWSEGRWNFDIVGASVSPSTVAQGSSAALTVSIKNVGNEVGTVKVYAGIEKPNGLREYLEPHTIFDIPVGQTRSTSWNYTPSAGSGHYKVDFDVHSPPETHMFDTTGFVHSLDVEGGSNDPTASRRSPSSSSVSLREGDSQTFVADLADADCDLLYAEWYRNGVHVHSDESPMACNGVTSWTGTFPSAGTSEVEVVVFDLRNDGAHVGRASWFVSVTSGDPGLPGDCAIAGTSLRFSGRNWVIREGAGGPGNPNNLDIWRRNNVECRNGNLVLEVTQQNGMWTTAQVSLTEVLGFGRYEWKVQGPVDDLDKNVVLGLFNYGGVDEEDEIDIELTRWGQETNPNGNYVVYPNRRGPAFTKSEFEFDLVGNSSTHVFSWQRDRVSFASFEVAQPLGSWEFAPSAYEDLIPQDPLPVYINLWMVGGNPPSNPAEVVIESFSWQPEAMPTSLQLPVALR